MKVKCTVSYDGTGFNGYQIQPGQRTVQGEIEYALYRIHKQTSIRVIASGRTDTGVHAKGQVIHFSSLLSMSDRNWKEALNTLLPSDVYIQAAAVVPSSFHARYDAIAKEYRYIISNESEPDVFKRHYTHHYPYMLDIEQMKIACSYLEGTHDFTTFSSAKASAKGSKIRTLHDIHCEQVENDITIILYGDGFLYKMVRILAGVLLDVGAGRIAAEDIPELLEQRDRRQAGVTAPSEGLYLWRVQYATPSYLKDTIDIT